MPGDPPARAGSADAGSADAGLAGAGPAGTEPVGAGSAAADFDRVFSVASPGIRRVWELVEPELPPEIEPLSFVSLTLLRQVAGALDLSPGQRLVDLGCGRGGPGLWLARAADAALTGVDFSAVAVAEATRRAASRKPTSGPPRNIVRAGRPGQVRGRRSHQDRAAPGQRRRRRVGRRLPLRG